MSLNHKIDFAVIFTVTNANPNGDPLDGNRPRTHPEAPMSVLKEKSAIN